MKFLRGKMGMLTILILIIMKGTDGLTWNTKIMASVCCQGNNQFLVWNFTKGENERVTQLHWFFNKKTLVCYMSTSTGFVVADLYKGRVEWNGTTGILLKNVSLNDTGEYTLYVKLEEEKERNVQGINLTVVEPPPIQCKPIIKREHFKGIISCFTSCERSPLSLEWIINGTKVPEVIGPYLVVDSLWTSEQSICCLRDFKCVDDYQFKFCTPNHFLFTEDMHRVNQSVTDTYHMDFRDILILTVMVVFAVLIACVILKRRCRSFFTVQKHEKSHDMDRTREVPFSEKPSPIMETVQEPDADVKLHQIQVAVEPTHSNTFVQFNEDLQQFRTVAATTDRPLQDSNQHIQIVNNISIDTDFVKSITHPNRALMAEIQAIRKETRKLKWQLHQEKHLRKKENRPKYSYVTPVKCRYFKKNDTDSCETSEWEDALSELLPVEGIVSCQSQGYSSGSQHGL